MFNILKKIILCLSIISLSACAPTKQEILSRLDDKCQKMGFKKNSNAWKNCMLTLANRYDADRKERREKSRIQTQCIIDGGVLIGEVCVGKK